MVVVEHGDTKMVEASLGDRGRVVAGDATGLPAQALAGRLHQCRASTTCTAVLSWAVELSESSGSSSALRQHCVCTATVPMLYLCRQLCHTLLQLFYAGQHRFAGLPQRAHQPGVVERAHIAAFAVP